MSSLTRRAAIAPPDQLHSNGDHGEHGPSGGPSRLGNAAMQDMLAESGTPGSLPFRSRLEQSFGANLGGLEVYQGDGVDEALGGISAGGAFADGRIFLPKTASFEQVTHEVTHALQGEGGGQGVSTGGEAAEQEAHEVTRAVTQGQPAVIQESRSAGVHRWGLGDLWDGVKDTASNAWSGVKDTASSAWSGVKDTASSAWDWTKDTASNAWDGAKDLASDTWEGAKGVASNTWDTVSGAASSAWDWTKNKASDAWDWTKETASNGWEGLKSWGTDRLIDAGSWVLNRYDDTWKPGLDWARGKLDGLTNGVSTIANKGSDWLGGALDWVGWEGGADAVRGAGDWVNDKVEDVRDLFGLDEKGNSFTHYMEVPANADGFVQQYSELGIPIAEDAWKQQDAIDGGKLHALYNRSMLSHLADSGAVDREKLPDDLSTLGDEELQELTDRTILPILQESGVLNSLVESGALAVEDIPASFDDLSADQITALAAKARTAGADRALLDAMPAEERTAFQEGVLNAYIEMANNDPNAAMLLDLMPTETDKEIDGGTVGDILGDAFLKGQEPNDFTIGARTGLIRTGAATMAEELRASQGVNTYGLVVPYANTVENILFREGKPTDAAEHVHNYMSKMDKDMTTLLNGYSQGAGGVQEYLRQYGNKDGLDYAISLAPMGGASKDSQGGHGMWAGDFNGVSTLTLENKEDPAQYIYGDNLSELGPGLLNFVAPDDKKKLGGQSDIHSGFDATNPGAGTYGYPMELGRLLMRDLFGGAYTGDYQRRGDWDYDLRTLTGDEDWAKEAAQYR